MIHIHQITVGAEDRYECEGKGAGPNHCCLSSPGTTQQTEPAGNDIAGQQGPRHKEDVDVSLWADDEEHGRQEGGAEPEPECAPLDREAWQEPDQCEDQCHRQKSEICFSHDAPVVAVHAERKDCGCADPSYLPPGRGQTPSIGEYKGCQCGGDHEQGVVDRTIDCRA